MVMSRIVALVAAGALGLGLTGSGAQAIGTPRHPVVAPYLDVSEPGSYSQLYRAVSSDGLRNVTAAFVLGDGCTPTWDDSLKVSQDPTVSHLIARARAEGAHVIVSFGGEDGTELATSCASRSKLTSAYRSVIRRFHAHDLDFDIEGAAIADHPSIVRRFAVLHALQHQARHPLHISLTVPTLPSGLDSNGIALLKAARRADVNVDLVNIMAMDYGTPTSPDMGTAAVDAAKGAMRQIRKIWPGDGFRRLGITPMIGQNDTANEQFTLADARRVTRFAHRHHVGRLAFWSLGRDQPCARDEGNDVCSHISQSRLQFIQTFLAR